MFSDGRQVFDLSHLLEYRRQQLTPPPKGVQVKDYRRQQLMSQLKWIKSEEIRVSGRAT